MIYALDAQPAYEHVIHEASAQQLNASVVAGSHQRPAAQAAADRASSPHCIVRSQGEQRGIAICDDGTVISFGTPKARAHKAAYSAPAQSAGAQPMTQLSSARLRPAAANPAPATIAIDDDAVSRRWTTNLLATIGLACVLVSLFLFVTGREPRLARG